MSELIFEPAPPFHLRKAQISTIIFFVLADLGAWFLLHHKGMSTQTTLIGLACITILLSIISLVTNNNMVVRIEEDTDQQVLILYCCSILGQRKTYSIAYKNLSFWVDSKRGKYGSGKGIVIYNAGERITIIPIYGVKKGEVNPYEMLIGKLRGIGKERT
jgi:hypothetical protein